MADEARATSGRYVGSTVPFRERGSFAPFANVARGAYFLAIMFFAGAGIALLICSSAIDYSRRLPV